MASFMIGIDDVFDARIACVVDHDLAEVAEHLELLVLELAHRLDHELAVGEARRCR